MLESILEFYFNPQRYKGLADSPVDARVLVNNIKRIQKKTDEIAETGIHATLENRQEILDRIIKDFERGLSISDATYSRKELKCLSYSIGADNNYGFLDYCLKLLANTWSDSYLRGIIHSLLGHWTDMDDGGRKLLCSFFKGKTDSSTSRYAGQIRPLLPYLNASGPYKLGNKVRGENRAITDICRVFGLSTNRISYSFFSDAIVGFYETIGTEEFPQLKEILKQHNNTRTSKIVVSKLIIRFQDEKSYREQIMDFAVEMIGDPTLESNWAPFPNATREEEKNLESARKILLRMYAERAIDTFFKYLCTDERRRKFWKRYSKRIDNFMVYGPIEGKNLITPYINYNFLNLHFKQVNSSNPTCGLVLYMEDYAIIEFSDTGALYVYRKGGSHYESVFSSSYAINRIDDLKLSYLSNLVNQDSHYLYHNDEGRLIHSGHWEQRMGSWIERKIG